MLILASQSPRRFDLLSLLGIPFETIPADIDETVDDSLPPEKQVICLAKQKAAHVFRSHPDDVVIGSDTLVFLNGISMGKPVDETDARRMLSLLAGKTHQAITGVCICSREDTRTFFHTTHITFDEICPSLMDWYIATGEPMGSAGAYQIQNRASVFTKEMTGTVSGTMGFPMDMIARHLQEMGLFLNK